MGAELIVLNGPQKGQVFPIEKEEAVIGRASGDISLADVMVSRHHARITWRGGVCEVEDMGSRNGVFVNESKVTRARLCAGDKLLVGSTLLLFHDAEPMEIEPDETMFGSPAQVHRTITLDASKRDILTLGLDEHDIRMLQRAKSDLAAVYSIGQVINSILNTQELLSRVLDLALREIPQADTCSLHLINEKSGELECKAYKCRASVAAAETPVFSRSIDELVMVGRKAVLTYDAEREHGRHKTSPGGDSRIHSVMCVPLQSRDRMLGVLQANTLSEDRRFDRDNLKLLTAIGMQAGAAIENSSLYEKLQAEKAGLREANEKLKAAQDSLVLSEKLAAVGRLAAGIIHDIKNPMTVILSHAELMEMVLKRAGVSKVGDLDLCDSLRQIQQGVLHCNEVISQLLHFARQSKTAKATIQINDIVMDTIAFLSHEIAKHKAEVETRLCDSLPSVYADPNQMKQVFLNILINALQAAPAGPRILVTTNSDNVEGRELVSISFTDNGTGMTEDVKRRLFEPFFTTKEAGEGLGGTGMGLCVSYGIVRNHGGTIEVESEPGRGSTFTVRIPPPPPGSATQEINVTL